MRPDRQAQSMKMLAGSHLLAADAMLSYVMQQTREARDVLRRSSWFFCNADEFAALGGGDPEHFRRNWWLEGLVLKAGPGGVTGYTADGSVRVPALTDRPALDTTGAGDALAGGMLARWLSTGGQPAGLWDALVCGVACASLTIDAIGARGIASASSTMLEERMAEVWECLRRKS
jgi:sugar/nucleoside kinase (ribokinase family)